MASYDYGKQEIVAWIKANFKEGSTCLDVGACDGKWHDLLGDYLVMDAVEIFEPNIENNNLHNKYRSVICGDINNVVYDWYDLIIFGDVIEHMEVEKAQNVIAYALPRCKDMIVAVPFQMEQEEMYGNPYEKHIQDDLTAELFHERYPYFQMLICESSNSPYAYYMKNFEWKTKQFNSPKFSIIVPAFNSEDYIRKGLESIVSQEFKDFELIVVCDSCNDNTFKIAKEYDARAVIVNYNRNGLSRNAGLDIASGEWILFMDDDDWFLHEYVFSSLDEVLGKMDTDLLNFAFIWKGKGYCKQSISYMEPTEWCRCYRRDFIGNTRFNDKQYDNDHNFFRDLLNKKPSLAFWDVPLYYYNYMRVGSLSEIRSREDFPGDY